MLALLTDSANRAELLSQLLLANGIFHYVDGLENGCKLCDEKEIGAIILDGTDNLSAAKALCATVRERYQAMPIAVLVDVGAVPDMEADRIIRDTEEVTQEVLAFCHTVMGRDRQILSTRQLYITDDPDDTRYLGYQLRLSEAEHRLLLCLTYLAPRVAAPDELRRLCDPGQLHSAKSLAVRISAINQKAKAIHPRTLIRNVFKQGYVLNPDVL